MAERAAEICLLVIITTISRVFPQETHGVVPQDQDIMGTSFTMDEGEGEGWGSEEEEVEEEDDFLEREVNVILCGIENFVSSNMYICLPLP